MKIHYARIYSDKNGDSHFTDEEVEAKPSNFAPPAAPLNTTVPVPVTQFLFLVAPQGWYGDWHPAPHKQLMILVSGEVQTAVSDGEVRRFRQGDVVLVEDTSGKGHTTRSVDGNAIFAVAQLSA
jgi:quercetin dioxygenase-like cupin family protein